MTSGGYGNTAPNQTQLLTLVRNYTNDAANRLTTWNYAANVGSSIFPVQTDTYTYDNTGNRLTKQAVLTGETGAPQQTNYTYDFENRLTALNYTNIPNITGTQTDNLTYMEDPCGVIKMMHYLRRLGHLVGEKLVRRLMRSMNLLAIYPKPRLSQKNPEHRIYPYLLRGVAIIRANQVWATDITYIQLARGFCYLVAIMDWYSRYVVAVRDPKSDRIAYCIVLGGQGLPNGFDALLGDRGLAK